MDDLQLPEDILAHKDQQEEDQMDSGRTDDHKIQGGPYERIQVIQKDNTTTTTIDMAVERDKTGKKTSDMSSSESRVSLGFVDDDFIQSLKF